MIDAMITAVKKMFRTPSAQELAQRELLIARRELLEAQRGVEYHESIMSFNLKRIQRLEAYVKKNQEARHA